MIWLAIGLDFDFRPDNIFNNPSVFSRDRRIKRVLRPELKTTATTRKVKRIELYRQISIFSNPDFTELSYHAEIDRFKLLKL